MDVSPHQCSEVNFGNAEIYKEFFSALRLSSEKIKVDNKCIVLGGSKAGLQ